MELEIVPGYGNGAGYKDGAGYGDGTIDGDGEIQGAEIENIRFDLVLIGRITSIE